MHEPRRESGRESHIRSPIDVLRASRLLSGARPLRASRPIIVNRARADRRRPSISSITLLTASAARRIFFAIIAVIIIGGGGYVTIATPAFTITTVKVNYEEFQSTNYALEQAIAPLKGKNILFANTDAIIVPFKQSHPQLQTIIVKKQLPHTINVTFSDYPIVANIISTYIDPNDATKTEQKKFLINEVGITMHEDTENPNLPYIKVTTPEPITINSAALTQDQLTYILNAEQYFEEKFGIKITETQLLKRERELHLKTGKSFSLWLDLQIPYERQFLKLKRATPLLDIQATPLDYIDLRISGTQGEKIIFKRKK